MGSLKLVFQILESLVGFTSDIASIERIDNKRRFGQLEIAPHRCLESCAKILRHRNQDRLASRVNGIKDLIG